jgi:hypothetical protein
MTVNADHGQKAQRSYGPGDPCSCDRERFGEHIPLIRRQDVKGFITRKPLWLATNLPVAMIRREAEIMEDEAAISIKLPSRRRATLGCINYSESSPLRRPSITASRRKWMSNRKPPGRQTRKANPNATITN